MIPNKENLSDSHQDDIQSLKNQIKQLNNTVNRFRDIFSKNRDGIVFVDSGSRIIDVNEVYCTMLGYTKEELLALDNFYAITPKKWHHWELTEIWENRLLNQGYSGIYEKEYIRKDGTLIPVELQSYAVFTDDGSVDYLWGIAKDISDRKQVEATLNESEKQLQQIAQNVPGCLFQIRLTKCGHISVRYMIDESNMKIDEMEMSPKDASAKYLDSVHPDDQFRFEKILRTSAESLKSFQTEHRVLLPNGLTAWLNSRAQPERQSNGDIIWTGISINITDRVIAEENLRESQSSLKALIENTDTSIWSIDTRYRLILGNTRFHQNIIDSLGKPFLKGDSVFPVTLPDSVRLEWKEYYDRALRGERFSVNVWRQFGKEPAFMEYRLNPILSENGQIEGVTVFSRDTTLERTATEKVRKSEIKYKALFDNINTGIAVHEIIPDDHGNTKDFVFLDVNPAFEKLVKLKKSEIIGKTGLEIFPNISKKQIAALGKVAKTGQPFTTIEHSEKIDRFWEVKAYSPESNQFAVTLTDITERKQMEQALRSSEQHFRKTIESISDGFIILEKGNQNISYINSMACQLIGCTQQSALGQKLSDVIPDASNQQLCIEVITALEHNEQIAFEVFFERNSMSEWLDVRVYPGETTTSIFIQAITQRKMAEEKYITLFQSTSDAIFVMDRERFIDCNNATMRIFGCQQKTDIIGHPPWYFSPEFQPSGKSSYAEVKRYVKRALSGESCQFYWEHQKLDGTTFHTEVTLDKLNLWENNYLLAVVKDITKRVEADNAMRELQERFHQAQKMESIGRLAGGVAHDLNNLLSPILGYAEILLDETGQNDSRQESILEIIGAGKRARDLVRQLLAFSRRQTMEFKPVNINNLLLKFKKLLRRTIREDISIDYDLAKNISNIIGDHGQLEQVIMNLAVNAQDAMEKGGQFKIATRQIEVTEDSNLELPDGSYINIKFCDTGSGISSEDLEQIFEPFFTTKNHSQGTGLGLATVFGIIKQHRGQILATSKVSSGTIFDIYLPATNLVETDHHEPVNKTKAKTDSMGTILLVEDNHQVRQLTKKILDRCGYKVFAAENGADALQLIHQYSGGIDLLLTDVIMPEMNGLELFQNIKEIYPEMNVMFMSGYSDSSIMMDLDIEDLDRQFIQKPFSVKKLTEMVSLIMKSDL